MMGQHQELQARCWLFYLITMPGQPFSVKEKMWYPIRSYFKRFENLVTLPGIMAFHIFMDGTHLLKNM